MPIIPRLHYVVLDNLNQVRSEFEAGHIVCHDPEVLARLLDIPRPARADPSPRWLWACTDRVIEIESLPPAQRVVFLCLMISNQEINPLAGGSMPDFGQVKMGRVGNGSMESGMFRPATDRSLQEWDSSGLPSLNWTPDIPNLLRPGQLPVGPRPLFNLRRADARPLTVGQAIRPIIRLTRPSTLLHLCQPLQPLDLQQGQAPPPWAAGFGGPTPYALLDTLSREHANEHGKMAGEVAGQMATTNRAEAVDLVTYASASYPTLAQATTPNNWYRWLVRYNVALLNKRVLSLQAGDVLFITTSVIINNKPLPAVYDYAAFQVITWLESKGVAVIVSASGTKVSTPGTINQNLDPYFAEPSYSPCPGILVGGISAESPPQFTSNFGDVVCCYMPPHVAPTFDQSSGAAAQIAGLVFRMQRYARTTQSRLLTIPELKTILRAAPQRAVGNPRRNVPVPSWAYLQQVIDNLA